MIFVIKMISCNQDIEIDAITFSRVKMEQMMYTKSTVAYTDLSVFINNWVQSGMNISNTYNGPTFFTMLLGNVGPSSTLIYDASNIPKPTLVLQSKTSVSRLSIRLRFNGNVSDDTQVTPSNPCMLKISFY